MKQFRVSIEETRKGNYRLRLHYPDGRRVASGHCIEAHESATINGKPLVGKSLAKALAKKLHDEYLQKRMGSIDPETSLEECAETFLQESRANGQSGFTLTNRTGALRDYIRDNDLKTLGDSTHETIMAWKMLLSRQGLQNSTIVTRLASIRRFHSWLEETGRIHKSPFGRRMMPMIKDKEPQYYTAGEFKALDEAMASISAEGRIGINLAHECGLRLIEMVGDGYDRGGVLWEDITWYAEEAPDLLIRKEVAKGGAQSGMVSLTEGVLKVLGSRRTGPLVPMSRKWFYGLFSRARTKAGINPKLDIHGLRDSFAKNFLQRSGENLAALQKVMRHKNIKSTMVYVQFERSHLKAAVERSYAGRLRDEALLPSAGGVAGIQGVL